MSTQPTTRRLVTEASLADALAGVSAPPGSGTTTGAGALVFNVDAQADAAPDNTILLRYVQVG